MKSWFEKGSYPEIDGLRALAILLVLFTHIFQTIPGLSYVSWNTEWMTPLFNGWMGVDLFFVLSGFLIGGQILKQLQDRKFSFRRFYLRRAFRILPAYYAVLLAVVAIQYLLPGTYLHLTLDPFAWKGMIKNLLLITDYFPHDAGIGSWSLSIEEQFYWIIPALLFLTHTFQARSKAKLLIWIWGAALVFRMITYRHFGLGPDVPISMIHSHIYFPFHTRMDGLAAGVLIAVCLRFAPHSADKSLLPTVCRGVGLAFTGFILLTGGLKGGWLETTLQYSLLSIGFAFLTWGTLSETQPSLIKQFLGSVLWTPIARLSYSIYLTHLLSIRFVESYFQNPWLKPGLMVVFSIGSAMILYLIIEQPIHRWAQRRF